MTNEGGVTKHARPGRTPTVVARVAGAQSAVGPRPDALAFDGTNIWVANFSNDSVTVATATALGHRRAYYRPLRGLSSPAGMAFDGTRYVGD